MRVALRLTGAIALAAVASGSACHTDAQDALPPYAVAGDAIPASLTGGSGRALERGAVAAAHGGCDPV